MRDVLLISMRDVLLIRMRDVLLIRMHGVLLISMRDVLLISRRDVLFIRMRDVLLNLAFDSYRNCMVGNSSSKLADVPLSIYELNYQLSLIKNKKFNLAKRLPNNKRFVDDLGVIDYTSFASRIPKTC